MNENRTLAVDIGGTFIKYGLIDPDYRVSRHHKVPTLACSSAGEFFDYLCENIPAGANIERIGISCPGLIDRNNVVRSYAAPRLHSLYGANLYEEMKKRTGIGAQAINDAKAAGLCELKLGNARGSKLSACLIIGTGGGGCICLEDNVFWGADGFAGEFHFMAYPDERTGETLKTGREIGTFGLINRYNARAAEEKQVKLGKEITDRYFAGEKLAGEVVPDWIHRIALQCLTINVTIDPEILLIGGGISEENWFMEAVKKEYAVVCRQHFDGAEFLSAKIDRCRYLNDANLLGAALHTNHSKYLLDPE